jgi:hypothetical protein
MLGLGLDLAYKYVNAFLGGDDPANAAEPDATAYLLMDGPFFVGQSWRSLAPTGSVNDKTSYSYSDESVQWNGSQWIYANSGSGTIAVSSDHVQWPWLATWNNNFAGAKVTSTYSKSTNYPAVP